MGTVDIKQWLVLEEKRDALGPLAQSFKTLQSVR